MKHDLFTDPSFYNTTNEVGSTLKEYRAKAQHQDEEILAIFGKLKEASPSQVHRIMQGKCPLTSVRRACTNLTNAGKLVKTDRKTQGAYGRAEYLWKLVSKA